MRVNKLNLDSKRLGALCRRNKVKRLYVFGSQARGDATPESDVDFFVEYKPEYQGTIITRNVFIDHLEALVGTSVDLANTNILNNRFRAENVLKDRVQVYEAR